MLLIMILFGDGYVCSTQLNSINTSFLHDLNAPILIAYYVSLLNTSHYANEKGYKCSGIPLVVDVFFPTSENHPSDEQKTTVEHQKPWSPMNPWEKHLLSLPITNDIQCACTIWQAALNPDATISYLRGWRMALGWKTLNLCCEAILSSSDALNNYVF